MRISKERKSRLSKIFFQTPIVNAFIMASFIYHDYIWYPSEGWGRVEKWLDETEWGRHFLTYGNPFEKQRRSGLRSLLPVRQG